jgi:hypothetical protein
VFESGKSKIRLCAFPGILSVPQETLDLIHRRGCAAIRGQVSKEMATGWDQSLVDYVDSNDFDEKYRGPADNFFKTDGAGVH